MYDFVCSFVSAINIIFYLGRRCFSKFFSSISILRQLFYDDYSFRVITC